MISSGMASGTQKSDDDAALGTVETGRRHADHGVALPVQRHTLLEDARVTAEAPLPETVAEHCHGVATDHLVFLGQDGRPSAIFRPRSGK